MKPRDEREHITCVRVHGSIIVAESECLGLVDKAAEHYQRRESGKQGLSRESMPLSIAFTGRYLSSSNRRPSYYNDLALLSAHKQTHYSNQDGKSTIFNEPGHRVLS
jgi:hypothetical protein